MSYAALIVLLLAGCLPTFPGYDGEEPDGDGDGYRGSADCDDTDASVHQGAVEWCDGKDNDCDDDVDEDAADMAFTYVDGDRDGFGGAENGYVCEVVSGLATVGGDCDDHDGALHPETWWYLDLDSDGWGDPMTGTQRCLPLTGYVLETGDCDDLDADVNPGESEVCDDRDVDEDCDDLVDDTDASATGQMSWWWDDDGDGFGDPATEYFLQLCDPPDSRPGWVRQGGDCDDASPALHPATVWYEDGDGDGYGDPEVSQVSCTEPAGPPAYVLLEGDCDDVDGAVHPGVTEVCNGADDDCSGEADELPATGTATFYADADGDGHGDPGAGYEACAALPGDVENADDCDDADPLRHPGTEWYADTDGDGWGDAAQLLRTDCSPVDPLHESYRTGDCDDTALLVNPDAPEVPDDGIDQDCNGLDLYAIPVGTSVSLGAFGGVRGVQDSERVGRSALALPGWWGDGRTALVVGRGLGVGAVEVYEPPAAGAWIDKSAAVAWMPQPGNGGNFGAHLAAGDHDGDGVAELAIGATTFSDSLANRGAIYVVSGPRTGAVDLDCARPCGVRRVLGSQSGLFLGDAFDFGWSLSEPTEARADLFVGAWSVEEVVALPQALVTNEFDLGASSAVVSRTLPTLAFGMAVARVDADGDGLSDVLIGAPASNDGAASYAGRAFLFFAGAALPAAVPADADADFVGRAHERLGYALAEAGDVDGDGYPDLLIGAPSYLGGPSIAGRAYVAYGPFAGSSAADDLGTELVGESGMDFTGSAVASAGDVDGDGRPDVLVGAERMLVDGFASGGAYLVVDVPRGTVDLATAALRIEGETYLDLAGSRVGRLGDVDGDGHADLYVTAPLAALGGDDRGAVYVLYATGL